MEKRGHFMDAVHSAMAYNSESTLIMDRYVPFILGLFYRTVRCDLPGFVII